MTDPARFLRSLSLAIRRGGHSDARGGSAAAGARCPSASTGGGDSFPRADAVDVTVHAPPTHEESEEGYGGAHGTRRGEDDPPLSARFPHRMLRYLGLPILSCVIFVFSLLFPSNFMLLLPCVVFVCSCRFMDAMLHKKGLAFSQYNDCGTVDTTG